MIATKIKLTQLCVLICFTALTLCSIEAQTPTSWWPDGTTGLMWTGSATHLNKIPGINWQSANQYCTTLQLGGYSDWRLPTLDEVKAITYFQPMVDRNNDQYFDMWLKGGIKGPQFYTLWTSTMSGSYEAWTAAIGDPMGASPFNVHLLTDHPMHYAICTRRMEDGLSQLAKDAQIDFQISDNSILNKYASLGKSRTAYHAGNYQESITQAKNALLLYPDFADAYWAIGISYGRLKQWDLAISNLNSALKIDKNYKNAKAALKWAKEGQSAAKQGKVPKILSPKWN